MNDDEAVAEDIAAKLVNLAGRALPKWPAMTVVGERVTPEQAEDILLVTNNWWHMCNDHAWEREVYAAVGLSTNIDRFDSAFLAELQQLCDRLGVLSLGYLENARIMSAWIGGTKGWCDWNGQIFTNNYNIGKWPSIEDVHDDWVQIATRFPFLNLKCQLWNKEASEEGETHPVVQFDVRDGKVLLREPENLGVVPAFNVMASLTTSLGGFRSERATVSAAHIGHVAKRLAAQRA
jgi:hypothetical protein